VDIELSQSTGEVVGDADVVDVKQQVLERDMQREERRRQEKSEEKGMRGHRTAFANDPAQVLTRRKSCDHLTANTSDTSTARHHHP